MRRVEGEPDVSHVDDVGERDRRADWATREGGAVSVVSWRRSSRTIPTLLSVEIFRRAKLAGYFGRQERALRADRGDAAAHDRRPLVRFEGLPGEFSQHDFGQVDVRFLDGTTKRVHFFASRLKYSRWVEVTIVPDERDGDAGPHAGRSLRGHRRDSALGGLRSAEDGRVEVGARTAR